MPTNKRVLSLATTSVVLLLTAAVVLLSSPFVLAEDVATTSAASAGSSPQAEAAAASSSSKPAVFLASPGAKQRELLRWINENQAQFRDYPILLSPEVKNMVEFHPFISQLNIQSAQRTVSPAVQQQLRESSGGGSIAADEVMVAGMALRGEIGGVVYFRDTTTSSLAAASTIVDHACDVAGIPLAVNAAAAEYMLRGVMTRYKRRAYLLFNPVAGHGDPRDDLDVIRRVLEPQIDLTIVYT